MKRPSNRTAGCLPLRCQRRLALRFRRADRRGSVRLHRPGCWRPGSMLAAIAAIVLWLPSPAVAASPSDGSALQFDGFVEPLHDLQIAASEPGRLEEMLVQVGDRVQAGQVVAVLEDGMQRSAVAIARLQTSMEGQRNAAQAERDLHAARTEQLRRLQADQLARPDEVARQETDLRIAEARLLTVEEELQLRLLELERFELQLQRRQVRAPIAGTVARVYHKGGEFVSPTDPAVIRLITTDQLVAVVNVPAEQMQHVSVGGLVRVHLAMARRMVSAKVYSIAPAIDGESGTVQVRVLLPNADGKLYAGDRCTVSVGTAPMRSALRSELERHR